MSGPQFSLEQLRPIVEARWRPSSHFVSHIAFNGKAAQVLGCNRKTVYRWAAKGLCAESADRVAHHLGMHPANIWPNWWSA